MTAEEVANIADLLRKAAANCESTATRLERIQPETVDQGPAVADAFKTYLDLLGEVEEALRALTAAFEADLAQAERAERRSASVLRLVP